MANQKYKIKVTGLYNGSSVKNNGGVSLGFKIPSSDLPSVVKLLVLLNQNIKVRAKTDDGKKLNLGMYMIKEVKISDDGETTLKLDTEIDYAEADNFNLLVQKSLIILISAEVELEDGETLDE